MTVRDVGRSMRRFVLENVGRLAGRMQETRPLEVDLLESETDYLVVFDAPGANKEDVQVRFVEGEVQVRIDRFREFHEGFEMRFPGRGLTLEGAVELPAGVAVEAREATATLRDDGTLDVRIPKADADVGTEAAEESTTAVIDEPAG